MWIPRKVVERREPTIHFAISPYRPPYGTRPKQYTPSFLCCWAIKEKSEPALRAGQVALHHPLLFHCSVDFHPFIGVSQGRPKSAQWCGKLQRQRRLMTKIELLWYCYWRDAFKMYWFRIAKMNEENKSEEKGGTFGRSTGSPNNYS